MKKYIIPCAVIIFGAAAIGLLLHALTLLWIDLVVAIATAGGNIQ